MGTILIVGTLDTKGAEFAYLRDLIRTRGHDTLVMDVGIFDPAFSPDIPAHDVAAAGGVSLDGLRAAQDRGNAVTCMMNGAAALVPRLYAEGRFQGVVSLGGSGNTVIATAAMRTLPVGVPKVMVSTVASGDVAAYIDVVDITLMYSVVDIAGLNKLSRRIIANAAGMICGAVEQAIPDADDDKPLVAATMFGVTTPCVTRVRERLETAGYDPLIFHATGSGGRAMEALIDAGYIAGVADVTTTEWGDQLVGGVLAAGEHRLEAAGKRGIPQVVSVGALDMVNFWAYDTVPERFRDRNLYRHNANVTLMRTTPEECAQLGHIIAQKLNAAVGKTALFLPLKGVSMIDEAGKPFYDPEADAALFDALRAHLEPHVERIELDYHINDPAFADAMADRLVEMLKG
ncbi:MAG: Tm-1-like ATP-binding domain-containing protein [bacterium]|nr:Tm-1-like ATP-binding domain-containing protein [bacterium]